MSLRLANPSCSSGRSAGKESIASFMAPPFDIFFSGPQYVAAVIVGAEGVKRCINVAQVSSYDNPQPLGTEGFSKVAVFAEFLVGRLTPRKCRMLTADCCFFG